MKLLMLLPNIAVLAISVYNIINASGPQQTLTFPVAILHIIVMALCITFIVLIIKSVITVRQYHNESVMNLEPQEQPYSEVKLRRV